jgi:DNA polymerase III alpha subunit
MADASPGFVHLHNHTTYSLLDGAQKIDEMCARAAADGQQAIAITDHGNLFGAMRFGRKAAEHGVRPIVGLEAYVAPGSREERRPHIVDGVGRKNYFHLVLLAENYTGYKNLIKLASAGYLEGFYYRPRIDKQLLADHSEGLLWPRSATRSCSATDSGSRCRITGCPSSSESTPDSSGWPATWRSAWSPPTTATICCPTITRRTMP